MGREGDNSDLIKREQLANYIVAIIEADWSRPDLEEALAILKAAEGQARTCIAPKPPDNIVEFGGA